MATYPFKLPAFLGATYGGQASALSAALYTDYTLATSLLTGITFQEIGSGTGNYVANPTVDATWSGIFVYTWTGSPAAPALPIDVLNPISVGGYATGQDPASLILVTPANKLATNSSGYVRLDFSQSLQTAPTVGTTGEALSVARAMVVGKEARSGVVITIYAHDDSTVLDTLTYDVLPAATTRTRS